MYVFVFGVHISYSISGTTETIPSLDGHNIIIVDADYSCLKHLLLIPRELLNHLFLIVTFCHSF